MNFNLRLAHPTTEGNLTEGSLRRSKNMKREAAGRGCAEMHTRFRKYQAGSLGVRLEPTCNYPRDGMPAA